MIIVSLIMLQVLVFGALIIMFKRIISKNVVSATQHLEELNEDYVKKEEKLNDQIEIARQEAKEVTRKTQDEAEEFKRNILTEAEKEKEKIIGKARIESNKIIQQAEKSRQLLISEIDKKIAGGSIIKACELIQNVFPEDIRRYIHLQWVGELIQNGYNQLKNINIPNDINEIKIFTAFNLTEDQLNNLTKILKDTIGSKAPIKEEVDSGLVAGIIISIGSLVLDGSLKDKIRKQAQIVQKSVDA